MQCTANQECLDASGTASVCKSGACASILSEDCIQVFGDLTNDSAIIFGVLAPLTGDSAAAGLSDVKAVALATMEIEEFGGGLPGGSDGARRPLVFVACDENVDVVRAARHLVDDVGVAAIIGPTINANALDVATQVAIPNGVLLVTPTESAVALDDLPDDGLVWQTTCSAELEARALPLIASELEIKVRTANGLTPSDSIRLALAARDDAWGQSMADAIVPSLILNGKTAVEEVGDGHFLQVTYPAGPFADVSSVIVSVIDMEPHVLIPLAWEEGVTDIMAGVETVWGATAPRPEYLLPSTMERFSLLALIGGDDAFRHRIRGTRCEGPGPGSTFDSFRLRYKAEYGADPGPSGAAFYDSAYVVAFAMVAAGTVPALDGKSIAAGMSKLSGGISTPVGPSDLQKAIAALASGATIDLEGASGHLDFDPANGSVLDRIEVWCVNANHAFAASGETYDPVTDSLEGSFACP
jgi:branched-chain amino acid transport system substrate-binding protein